MPIRHSFLALVFAMLVWSQAATAQTATGYGVTIMYYVNPDGTGGLIANPTNGGTVTWHACPPGGGCTPVDSRPTLDRALEVGTASVGTVFIATATSGSRTATASSVPYLGPVRSNTPPSFSGRLRVGALVKPIAGSWSGGWGSERSFLQMQICRRVNGTGCVVVADQVYWNSCPGVGAVLAPHHARRYLRVIDQRLGRDVAFTMMGLPSPSPSYIEALQPTPSRAGTIAGPIGLPTGPPESTCGPPPPHVILAQRAVRRGDRLEFGRIRCVARCTVAVDVRQKRHRKLRFKRMLPKGGGTKRLLLPVGVTRRIRASSFRVSVFFGQEMISAGRVKTSRH